MVSDALLLLSLALRLMTARRKRGMKASRRMSKDQEGRNIHEARRGRRGAAGAGVERERGKVNGRAI